MPTGACARTPHGGWPSSGCTRGTSALLSMLQQDEPCSQAHLADRMGVSPPAVLALLDSLESAGLVARQPQRAGPPGATGQPHAGRPGDVGAAQRTAATIQQEIADRLGPEADADLRALLAKLIADPRSC